MKFQNVSLKVIECPWKKVIVPENIIGSSYCTHVVDPSCAFVSACSVLCHGTVSLLVQTMACHLPDAKPLPKQMLTYWQLDTKEQTSVKLVSKYSHFHARKCVWKCCLRNQCVNFLFISSFGRAIPLISLVVSSARRVFVHCMCLVQCSLVLILH